MLSFKEIYTREILSIFSIFTIIIINVLTIYYLEIKTLKKILLVSAVDTILNLCDKLTF